MSLFQENQGILTDEQVPTLLDQYKTMPTGADRDLIGEQLLNWNESLKAKKSFEAELQDEQIFSDLGAARQRAGNIPALDMVADPDDIVAGAANQNFVARQIGKTREEAAAIWPSYRTAYSLQAFGKDVKTDKELFGLIGGQVEQRKVTREANEGLLGDAVANAIDDLIKGQHVSTPARVAGFMAKYPEAFAGQDQAALMAHYSTVYNGLQEKIAPYRDDIAKTLEVLKGWTGEENSGIDINHVKELANNFANMPRQDRNAVYEGVALAAKSQNLGADKGFALKLMESFGRGISDMTGKTGMAAQEAELLRRIDVAEGKDPFSVSRSEDGKVLVQSSLPGGSFALSSPKQATEADREQIVAESQEALKQLTVLRELKNIADGSVDPIRSDASGLGGSFINGLYGAARSAPYTLTAAIPAVGPALTGVAIWGGEVDRMALAYPDMDPTARMKFAAASAAMQAPIEWIKSKALFGKLPATTAFLKKISDVRLPALARISVAVGGNVVEQNLEETVQDGIPLVLDTLASTIREDMPEFNAEQAFRGYTESRWDTFFALLPMAMIGGGASTYQEVKRGAIYTKDLTTLRKAGLSEKVATDIAAEPDPAKRDEMIHKEWPNRTDEDIAAGVEMQNREIDKAKDSQESPDQPTMTSRVILGEPDQDGNPAREWTVTDALGKVVVTTRDVAAAEFAMEDERKRQFLSANSGIGEAAAYIKSVNEAIGRGEDVQKLLTEQAPRSLLAEYKANPTPATLDRLFETVRFHGEEISDKSELAEYFVRASNRGAIKDGVYRSIIRVHEGTDTDGIHVMRDFAQDNMKRAIAEGDTSVEWVREQLAGLTGTKGFEGLRLDTDTDVIESFSDVAVAYFHGRIKDESIPAKLRVFLRQLAAFMKQIFVRSYHLKRAIADGQVGENFEQFLAQSVGLDADQIVNRLAEKEQKQMFQEALVGADYSISKAQDARYLELAKDPEGNKDELQAMVDDRLTDVGAYWHGTPSGDLRGGTTGLHVGTKLAATEALEARIGIPADGKGWDGTREYGKTLLAGKDRINSGQFGKYRLSGFNVDAPNADYYPSKMPTVGDSVPIEPSWKPWIRPVLIVGDMTNSKYSPISDSAANRRIKRKRGAYYTNEGEDSGFVSAVLPDGDHVRVKSADPVTRDESGNVIPLSERFNPESDNINYSISKKETPAIADRGLVNGEVVSNDLTNSTVSIRAPEGATGFRPTRSKRSFQSAPGFPSDEVKIPQWQSARQPEILSERVKAVQSRVVSLVREVDLLENQTQVKRRDWERVHGKTINVPSNGAFYQWIRERDIPSNDHTALVGRRVFDEVLWAKSVLRSTGLNEKARAVSFGYDGSNQDDRIGHRLIDEKGEAIHQINGFEFEQITTPDGPIMGYVEYDFAPFQEPKNLTAARNSLLEAEADLFLALEEEGGRADNLAAKESAAEWSRRTKAAEFAAILDARDEKAKNAARSFVSDVWTAFAGNDEVFQYGRTESKDAEAIAKVVSAPGKPVTVSDRESQITFIGKEGTLTINDADTARPYIRATDAKSQGKQGGGGSQLYAAALDWIHNNGLRIKDDSGLTDINAIRRTSNFLASALRHGTTKHLKPHAGQGLKWTKSDILNTSALAAKEMENAFKAVPNARGWEYDFGTGKFRDDAGKHVTRKGFAEAVRLGDPAKSGIGLSTLQRAIITHSAIRAFERGETAGNVLEAAGSGVEPPGVSYSISKAGENRVEKAMEAHLRRSPDARLAIYEAAKRKFNEVREKRGTSTDPNKKFASLLQSMGELKSILSVLPKDVRGKIEGYMTLANLGKDTKTGNRQTTIDKFLEKRIEMIGKELEGALQREYRAAITKVFNQSLPSKNKAGVVTSNLGPEASKFVKAAYAASLMDSDMAFDRLAEIEGVSGEEVNEKKSRARIEEWSIINAFGGLAKFDAEKLASALGELKSAIKGGREKWRIQQEARVSNIRSLIADGVKTLGEASEEDVNLRKNKKELLAFLKDPGNRHLAPFQLLEMIFGNDHPITRRFSDGLRKASNEKNERDMAIRRAFDDAGRVSLGFKPGQRGMKIRYAIDEELSKLSQQVSGVVKVFRGRKVRSVKISIPLAEKIVRGELATPTTSPSGTDDILQDIEDNGDVVMAPGGLPPLTKEHIDAIREELAAHKERLAERDFDSIDNENAKHAAGPKSIQVDIVTSEGTLGPRTMSGFEAMQFLATWGQTDGRAHMERNGFTEKSVEQMNSLVQADFAQSIYHAMMKMYADGWIDHNAVYRELFGTNMAKNENYSPFAFQIEAPSDAPMLPGEASQSGGIMAGHIKSRTKHNAPIQQINMANMFWRHFDSGNYWISHASLVRDMRSVLLNSDLMNSVTATHGEAIATALKDTVRLFNDGGEQVNNRVYEVLFSRIVSGISSVTLGFKLSSVMNQADAGARFSMRLTAKQQRRALASLFSGNFMEKYGRAFKSQTVQQRVVMGSNPLIRMARENSKFSPSHALQLVEAGYLPMQLVDGALTAFSGAVVYESAFLEAKEAGMNDTMADAFAVNEMDRAVFETAQPANMAQKSLEENMGGVFKRGYMMFMSDQRLKFAAWGSAYRGLLTGQGDKWEHGRVILALGLMGASGELVRSLYRDWFTDDDDEDIWIWQNFVRSFAMGPMSGFFLYGTIIESIVKGMLGERVFLPRGPTERFVSDVVSTLRNPDKLVDFNDPKATMRAWKTAARAAAAADKRAALPAYIINIVDPVLGLTENIQSDE
jgi:hypothetical protein